MTAHALRVGLLSFTVSLLSACGGGSSPAKSGPCAADRLEGCNTRCSDDAGCLGGLHCGPQGTCIAECTTASVADDCGADARCSPDGRCRGGTPFTPDRDGLDATVSSSDGPSIDGGVCADVSLAVHPKKPNVVLIVDQSGSMTANFGSGTRWTVLKDALLSDTGIIADLQDVVRFGIALFTYDENKDQTCPILTPAKISIALHSLDAIRNVYGPAEPGNNTPTGESVDAVLDQVQTLGLLGPDVVDPTIFILATDGNPDTCELPDQGAFGSANSLVATKRSIEAVKRAYTQGVKTYVIAVADEQDLAQSHLNDLANAGVGDPAAPSVKSAPSYRVDDDAGLRNALREIVTGQQSCDVEVDGSIVGDPSAGTVTLDHAPLLYDDANGWKLVDDKTIRLQGDACTGLKAGKPLSARFPCEAVVVK